MLLCTLTLGDRLELELYTTDLAGQRAGLRRGRGVLALLSQNSTWRGSGEMAGWRK